MANPAAEQRLEVGRITKAHGLRGEVVVILGSDRPERHAVGATLHSELGPLIVASTRAHQDRFVMSFVGVDTREAAESLRNLVLRGDPIDDPDELWVHELIGCIVRTPDGADRGVVESVLENPASHLLSLDSGALVPVVFVRGTPSNGVIHVDTPDGLFELGE